MEAKIAGQIIGPSQSGDPNKCYIIQIADGDLKYATSFKFDFRGWIPSTLISYIATIAVPMSFQKLNKIISNLPPVHESNVISLSKQEGAYNALTVEKLSTVDTITNGKIKAPLNINTVAKVAEKVIVKKPKSFLDRLTVLMEILSPWMITFIFIRTIVTIIRKRAKKNS